MARITLSISTFTKSEDDLLLSFISNLTLQSSAHSPVASVKFHRSSYSVALQLIQCVLFN